MHYGAVAEPLDEARAKRPLPYVGSFREIVDGEVPVKTLPNELVGPPGGLDSRRPRSGSAPETRERRSTPQSVIETGQDRPGLVRA